MITLAAQSAPNVVPTSSAATGDIAVGVLDGLYSAWLTNMVRLQTETLRFLAERAGKDVRTLERFAACRSPAEFARLQLQIGSEAVADYLAEARQMVSWLDPAINASALPVC